LKATVQSELRAKHLVLAKDQKQTSDGDPQTRQRKGVLVGPSVRETLGCNALNE
jgi:hypothetical protein